jgi:hypothetical protein
MEAVERPQTTLQFPFREFAESPTDCFLKEFIDALGGHLKSRDANEAFVEVIGLVDHSDLFDVSLRSRVEWPGGERLFSDGAQPLVRLAVRECGSIRDCLAEFLSPQFVDDFLVDGKPTRVSLSREFDSVSRVLVLQLSRFKNGRQPATQPIKPDDTIEVPVNEKTVAFRLQAMVGYCGTHYTAQIKKEDEWFEISDTFITKVTAENVRKSGEAFGYFFVYGRLDADAVSVSTTVNEGVL